MNKTEDENETALSEMAGLFGMGSRKDAREMHREKPASDAGEKKKEKPRNTAGNRAYEKDGT